MYLMVENIRLERETDSCGWRTARDTFRTELSKKWHLRKGRNGILMVEGKYSIYLGETDSLSFFRINIFSFRIEILRGRHEGLA